MLKLRVLIGMSVVMLSVNACKTANSSNEQALPLDKMSQLSQTQWIEACQSELNNPKTGADSRAELKQLANTEDCTTAFPVVKSIAAAYAKPSK